MAAYKSGKSCLSNTTPAKILREFRKLGAMDTKKARTIRHLKKKS